MEKVAVIPNHYRPCLKEKLENFPQKAPLL